MLLIPCPHCGPRDQTEFTYGGLKTPLPDLNGSLRDWHRAVHLRTGDGQVRSELWCHTAGCESWITVRRDLKTHQILPGGPR